jgi:hypothetical protein
MSVYNEVIQGTRARIYVGMILQENDPANNRSRVRVYGGISDANPSLGGFGTASYAVTTSNVGQLAFSTQAYDFTGDSRRDYRFYDNSNVWVPHSTDGSYTVTSTVDVSFFNSFIPNGSVSVSLPLTNYDRSPVFGTITTPSPTIRGVAYTGSFTASNITATNGYSLSAGALPTGLSLNVNTGAITGTPTVAGSYEFTITANGSFEGSTSVTKTIVVNPPAPAFTDSIIATTANLGSAYSDSVSASDAGYGITSPTTAYSIFSGNLPDGLTLDTSTGDITGTPTTPGIFNFVIRATNVTGTADTATLTITALSGGKVWNGTAFVSGTTKVWNGTAFVSSTTKIWDGSEWVSAS